MAEAVSAVATVGSIERADADHHLLRLMEAVAEAESLDQIYEAALACLRDTLGVRRASVMLFGETETMRFVSWEGLSSDYRRSVEGHTPWSPQDANAVPILVPDVRTELSLEIPRPALEREGIGALAFIPLIFSGKVVGKFMLYYDTPHVFGDDEIAAARLIAGHVSFAIERARMQEALELRLGTEEHARREAEREVALRRRLEKHEALLVEAGQVLSRSLDLDAVLRALSEVVVPHFADWYAVHLVDDEGNIAPAHIGHTEPGKVESAWAAIRHWPPRVDTPGGLAEVIRTGRPLWVPVVRDEILAGAAQGPQHLEFLRKARIRSIIIVPLAVSGDKLGAMTFVSSDPQREYGPAELRIAETLSNQAASAIYNARLYREAKEARSAAEDAASRLNCLVRVSEAIAPSLDPDAALQALARFCVSSSLADYCIAYRIDDTGRICRAGVAHADPMQQGLVEQLVATGSPRLDEPEGVGAVARTGKAALVPDISTEMLGDVAQDGQHSAHFEALRKLRPRSSMIVPLDARGRTVGALALVMTDRTGCTYDEPDLALARQLAERAALLVDNARLYREASKAKEAREEMLAIVSHDLRNPLGAIMAATDVLGLNPPPQRQADARASIRSAARQMSQLIEDLLDVTQVDDGHLKLHIESVDLGAVVTEIVSMHRPVAEERSLQLGAELPPAAVEVQADRHRVSQALTNVLANALKFTPAGGEVRLTLGQDGPLARIAVTDTGPGIPAEQLPHLFDRFWRADRETRSGLGLGLTIAKGILDAHGGTIEVDSRPGDGSRFTLVLPLLGPTDQSYV